MDKLSLSGGTPVIKRPFKEYNTIGTGEMDAVCSVMQSGVLSGFIGGWCDKFYGGEKVREFEERWKKRFGVNHAVSMNSATSCLAAAVGAIGVGPGDEVIVSPFTMTATATAILIFNAIPVFADIEPETFNIDPGSIEERITENTRALMIPNIFGHPADYDGILRIAKKYNLKIIEDNAQSPTAEFNGKLTGTIGDIGVFSLNYHKHIHTGEGGICTTNDDELAERLRLIRNHAEAVVERKGLRNLVNMIGFNFRLGEIEAAIGIEQLKKLDRVVSSRVEIAEEMTSKLSDIPAIQTPVIRPGCTHVFYVYPIRHKGNHHAVHRDKVIHALQAEGVPISGGYIKPLYLQPIFRKMQGYGDEGCPFKCPLYTGNVTYAKGDCPTAETMYYESLMIFETCRYDLVQGDINMISEVFHKVFSQLDNL